MTQPQRWEPDELLVPAALSTPKSPRRMSDLRDGDRAWLVAGLTLAGVTAQDIADRTDCSLRLVRSIRAEDITQMAVLLQTETARLETEARQERCEHAVTRRDLGELRRAHDRLQEQFDQVLDKMMAGELKVFPRCGHPRLEFNMYKYTDRSGKTPRERVVCRYCIAKRSSKYRASNKPADQTTRHAFGVTDLHSSAVRSAP